MYSDFQKEFLKETLHFSGCWLFLKKWNNESVVTNIILPTNVRKNVPMKFLENFQIKSPPPIKMGAETMSVLLSQVALFLKVCPMTIP